MKGDKSVIAFLNEVLKAELTAINQYFLHAEMCENWGYERLAKLIRKESIEEMVHAEKLMERILYLDGTPNMSDYFKINIGNTVEQQFKNDLRTGIHGREAPERRHPALPQDERRRIARAGGEDPERRRAPHRLAGSAAPRDRRDGHPELPGAAVEGRRVEAAIRLSPSSSHGYWPSRRSRGTGHGRLHTRAPAIKSRRARLIATASVTMKQR